MHIFYHGNQKINAKHKLIYIMLWNAIEMNLAGIKIKKEKRS